MQNKLYTLFPFNGSKTRFQYNPQVNVYFTLKHNYYKYGIITSANVGGTWGRYKKSKRSPDYATPSSLALSKSRRAEQRMQQRGRQSKRRPLFRHAYSAQEGSTVAMGNTCRNDLRALRNALWYSDAHHVTQSQAGHPSYKRDRRTRGRPLLDLDELMQAFRPAHRIRPALIFAVSGRATPIAPRLALLPADLCRCLDVAASCGALQAKLGEGSEEKTVSHSQSSVWLGLLAEKCGRMFHWRGTVSIS